MTGSMSPELGVNATDSDASMYWIDRRAKWIICTKNVEKEDDNMEDMQSAKGRGEDDCILE